MKSSVILRVLALIPFLTTSVFAQQNGIEILLDDTTLGNSVEAGETVTNDGITMTVTNVLATDGGSSAAVEDQGILFGTDTGSDDVVSLEISFNFDVRITAYVIGSREDVPDGMHITITGSNGSSGQNPVPEHSGFTEQEVTLPFVRGELPVLKAEKVYTITHNLLDTTTHDPIFNVEALSVTPVDVSIRTEPDVICIEYVGTLQEWTRENGWQDLNPQPPNVWQFTPEGPSKLFRAKR